MRKLLLPYLSLILIVGLSACAADSPRQQQLNKQLEELLDGAALTGSKDFFQMPMEWELNQIPQDPLNPLTEEKVNLGKMLFHETGIALAPMDTFGMQSYSCASCHFASAGFQAGRWQGIGDGGVGFGFNGEGRLADLSKYSEALLDVQPIRSPSAMNGAWQEVMLWNGQFGATGLNAGTEYGWEEDTPKETNHLGFQGLEIQAIAGLEVHRMVFNTAVIDSLNYKALFDMVFPEYPEEERYSKVTAGLAIAAYERTLLSNQAPFQEWLRGSANALSEDELEGALLFFDPDKGNCVSCHTGPALNADAFYALGMKDLFQIEELSFKTTDTIPERLGRGGFTGKEEDNYKFKVPQLYNLADSPFYGHGSSFRRLRDVVEYKNEGIPENPLVPETQLAEEFQPLQLESHEIAAITTFLYHSLRDPNLQRYEPVVLPTGYCFPNNDYLSQIHLDCQ